MQIFVSQKDPFFCDPFPSLNSFVLIGFIGCIKVHVGKLQNIYIVPLCNLFGPQMQPLLIAQIHIITPLSLSATQYMQLFYNEYPHISPTFSLRNIICVTFNMPSPPRSHLYLYNISMHTSYRKNSKMRQWPLLDRCHDQGVDLE